jgi:hypothetical protein
MIGQSEQELKAVLKREDVTNPTTKQFNKAKERAVGEFFTMGWSTLANAEWLPHL